jgi:hypothetical protein
MAGEKNCEGQCEQNKTTQRQKEQHGEINVGKWVNKKKTTTDSTDFHAYFTNLVPVMKVNNEILQAKIQGRMETNLVKFEDKMKTEMK